MGERGPSDDLGDEDSRNGAGVGGRGYAAGCRGERPDSGEATARGGREGRKGKERAGMAGTVRRRRRMRTDGVEERLRLSKDG